MSSAAQKAETSRTSTVRVRWWWEQVRAIITICVLGVPVFGYMRFLMYLGKIRFVGDKQILIDELRRGKGIVTFNHPSFLESILMPIVCMCLQPLRAVRLFIYSLPDKKTFPLPRYLGWFYVWVRCITVDRADPAYSQSQMRRLLCWMQMGASVASQPEGGRTNSPLRRSGKITWQECLQEGDRKVRPFNPVLVNMLASVPNVRFIPLYIEFGGPKLGEREVESLGATFQRLRRFGMTIYIGRVVDLASMQKSQRARFLARAVLRAGLPHDERP